MSKKNRKVVLIILLLVATLLFISTTILSYLGIGFFEKGLNSIDQLVLNVIGSTILVGVVTYISTKSISLYMSKLDFDRNNTIRLTFEKITPYILNYQDFITAYINSKCNFNLEKEDKDIVDFIFNQYNLWNFAIGTENQLTSEVTHLLNFPFVYKRLVNEKEDFIEAWKRLAGLCKSGKSKLIFKLLLDDNFEKFKRFAEIISYFQYYEITNMNSVNSTSCLITSDNRVDAKIHLLPNERHNIIFYYPKDKWIDCIAFRKDFDNKEEAVNIIGFKYCNDKESIMPIHINLSDYIKISNT